MQLGSWLLRADGGFTGRANSALPLGDPGLPLAGAVDEVEAWYRARGLPPMIVIPGPLGAAAARSSAAMPGGVPAPVRPSSPRG